MSTRKAHTSTTTTVNNGGSVVHAGSHTTGPLTAAVAANVTDDLGGIHGSTVVDKTVADDVNKANTSALLAANVGYQGDLYGTTNNPSPPTRSINKTTTTRTRKELTSFRAGDFNMFTGDFTSPPAVALDTYNVAVTGTTPLDQAANPTRAIPGELTFRDGSPNPASVDYEAKNG